MNQELAQFTYEGNGVRVLTIDGEPWFVSRDVAMILGARASSDITRMVDDEDKGSQIVRTLGGDQQMQVINESGIYTILFRSQAPLAKPFRRWVTSEVLPQIRKTGSYGLDPRSLDRRDILRMALEAEEQRLAAEKQLEAARPATEYFNRFVADADVCTVKDWGAAFGLTGPQAYQLLVEMGVVYRKKIGTRWSNQQHKIVEENEYRPYAGKPSYPWFDLRPQHNAPRLHNGQVRQTLYVRRQFLIDLGRQVGLTPPAIQGELIAADDYAKQVTS
ncbi:BRO family protein [Kocuria carniphila]|uniref:BRO family protein n=1 Tax=Kocuria carniphila TaxID=262208 RepID=UPI0034CECB0D